MTETRIIVGRPLSESQLRRRLGADGLRLRKRGDGYGAFLDGIPLFGWNHDRSLAEVQAWWLEDEPTEEAA